MSVITSGFEPDAGTCDGINEKGLVASLLYLVESEYPPTSKVEKHPLLCVSAWAQYVLDNYATVAEAVNSLSEEPFYVVAVTTPDGHPGTVHLAVSYPTGDSAIFEYIGGELKIHHDRNYQVMTNSPTYDQQLALNAYWQQIGGLIMLPGTNRAADRFVRASFYINAIPDNPDSTEEAIANAFSVIRNVSVPRGISVPGGEPNISSTLWRTVSDHKNKCYYFESTISPNVFWVDIADIDFAEGRSTKKLTLTNGTVFAGNVAAQFEPAEPFKFLEADGATT
ncbi:linear amide C-N hydrolase [Cylindrospermum sp. FACHB-282]|uniref:linear amide C-N hydrolase n=1 Tax=Cylindrospermum sp. FACHB-282 TaxID=2692794 RepID=UPI0016892ED5|nr:linear amide C-N hydrolase [Cylindrospermum sp. FACHB-282]MBD2387864.1 linear amide C-N hydrolase [Cylindrospermum sp. FACHB-282]